MIKVILPFCYLKNENSFSIECNKGEPYNITLKLSGCNDNEFTCSDGQCINIKSRCDQKINCRDKSDEQDCRLLILEDGYNKVVPPFTLVKLYCISMKSLKI